MTTIHIPAGKCLDGYLKANRDIGTTFVLEAGEYTTEGCFAFADFDLCMLAPGCSIRGEPGKTVLSCPDPILSHGGRPTGYTEVLTGGARSEGVSPFIEVSGIGILAPDLIPSVGVHLWTSQAKVTGVDVVDLWGSRKHAGSVKEGFGILINNGAESGGIDGGHRVFQCSIQLAEDTNEVYTTAFFIGCPEREAPMVRSTMRLCRAVATDGHAAYAFNDRVNVESCEAVGFRRAIFVDTGPVRDCHVVGMDAAQVGWALDLRGTDVKCGVTIRDSTFGFRSVEGWAQGIRIEDADVSGVHVEGCLFMAPSEGKASKARLNGPAVKLYSERDNRWVGAWENPVLQNGAGKVVVM